VGNRDGKRPVKSSVAVLTTAPCPGSRLSSDIEELLRLESSPESEDKVRET
jgi:hypothetical protein